MVAESSLLTHGRGHGDTVEAIVSRRQHCLGRNQFLHLHRMRFPENRTALKQCRMLGFPGAPNILQSVVPSCKADSEMETLKYSILMEACIDAPVLSLLPPLSTTTALLCGQLSQRTRHWSLALLLSRYLVPSRSPSDH